MTETYRHSFREIVGITFLYTAITLVMTYPIAFRPGDHYSVHNDYLQGLWNFWWFGESLFNLGGHPYFTDFVFHPTGVSLAYHTHSITNAIVAFPLQHIFGLVPAFNIVYLLTFVFSGLGAYLLVHDATGNRQAAFLSGLILAFCPYHFMKSYQIWAASLQWMPLFAFCFLRLLRLGGLKYAALSAVCLFFASLSSWYLMAFIFLFIGFALAYWLLTRRDRILTVGFAREAAFLGGLYGLLILPFAYPMIREVIFGESHMYTSLLAQFQKGSQGLIEGKTGSTFQVGMTQLFGIRMAVPVFWPGVLGYVVIILSLVGIFGQGMREKGLWVAASLLYFLFLLGPFLTIFDRVYRNVPLPWLILDNLPIFKALRYPHRFMAPFMMCVSVLAGSGAVVVARSVSGWSRQSGKKLATAAIVILSTLVLLEYFIAPISRYDVPMSPFYTRMSDDPPGEYAILEVPVMSPFNTRYMYFQSIHRKRIVGGQVVHPKEEIIDFIKTRPGIRELANPVLNEERGERIEYPEDAAEILKDLGIRYVIVHKEFLRPFQAESPVPGDRKRWGMSSLLPPFLYPQRNLMQDTFYYTMRKRSAFENPFSLVALLAVLEERLGPPVFEDDLIVVFGV